MPKPKPNEKMIRVSYTLPQRLKEEWDDFAKNTLYSTTSQMIRNAVQDYRLKFKQLNNPTPDSKLELMKMQIQKSINEEMNKYNTLHKTLPNNGDLDLVKQAEIKDSVLSLLEKLQPLNTKELAHYIRLSEEEALNILAILQEKDKLIKLTKKGWMNIE